MLSGDLEINACNTELITHLSNRHLARACIVLSITADRGTQRYQMMYVLVGRQLIYNHINIKCNVR